MAAISSRLMRVVRFVTGKVLPDTGGGGQFSGLYVEAQRQCFVLRYFRAAAQK